MKLFILLTLCVSIYGKDLSFLGINLEMTQEEILSKIENSTDLIVAEDILLKQLIPSTPYTLVLKANSKKNPMIKNVFIDFLDNKSYQITIFLVPEYFSFYTLSEKLLDKYGTPDKRSSIKVTWFQDNEQQKRITLEYPATIKFTDMESMQKVLSRQEQILEEHITESFDYQERKRILDEL